MRRFNRFQRRTSSSPKKNYSSRHSSDSSQHRSSSKNSSAKDNCCYKCKKPGHFIADCPLWEIEHKSKHSHSSSSSKSYRSSKNHDSKRYDSRSRKDKKDGSDDEKKKKYHKHREGSSSKYHSSRRKNSHRAKAYLGKEMNSEEEASGSEAGSKSRSGSGSGSESDGVAGIAFVSNKNSSSFFSNQSSEDESPAYCFMAKAKVSSSKKSYNTSDGSAYESDSRISYAKLAKIASIQQDELDSLSETIQKSETLLINEIEKGQTLTNEHIALKEKYDELSSRHDLLSVDYEKLTYEVLQRKMALEKLREENEELESVNLTLMAQQGSEDKNESTSPCLNCLEQSKIESITEKSKGKQPIVIDDANSSNEETITEELLRLRNLFETSMFKSVQGHNYLCDILRKDLLHRNPRNEGVGFVRKLNSDDTYWEPEQYPKTVLVLAKEKPIDIANLSGFHCKMDKAIVDESLDSDYKLIKDE